MGGAVHLVRSSRQEACHAIALAPVTCTTGIMLFLITTSGDVPIPARSCGSPVPPARKVRLGDRRKERGLPRDLMRYLRCSSKPHCH